MRQKNTPEQSAESHARKLLHMRQYRARKTGASIPKNFELLYHIEYKKYEPVVKEVLCEVIYPPAIAPIPQKFDGVETIASVMGRKELYLVKM